MNLTLQEEIDRLHGEIGKEKHNTLERTRQVLVLRTDLEAARAGERAATEAWKRLLGDEAKARAELAAANADRARLREALAVLNLAVRVALAFQRPTDVGAHLLDVERVSTSADLVCYLRVALDRERAALLKEET